MKTQRRGSLPTYFGPGFWVTWCLGSVEVVAYAHGIKDHEPEHQDEEVALAKQGLVWVSAWSPLTHGIPDHSHEHLKKRGAVHLAPEDALARLEAMGVTQESLRSRGVL